MWNKQRTDEVLLDVDDVAMGQRIRNPFVFRGLIYCAALDASTDPAVVTDWISQTQPNAPAPKPISTPTRATAHAA
ncbi:hypothetical protein V6V47_14195 [Micromonospora sp. CPCC 205539]|uniref:hypothetical protein n=1 Tax=Micromonospora sp. CPCC 205539 TaxID=3122408 RepID=UPI002FF14596